MNWFIIWHLRIRIITILRQIMVRVVILTTIRYEKPDIGFNDFTAYQTKLKVVYKIYNKDKAKVTSAKVYYGTSSNPIKVSVSNSCWCSYHR